MLSQLSIKTDPKIKANAQKKALEQGVPLTFVVNTFLRGYAEGAYEIKLVRKENSDVTIDELFKSQKIKDVANKVADFVSQKDL